MAGGGAERQLIYLGDELARQGHEVHVALSGRGVYWEKLVRSAIHIHELNGCCNYDPLILVQLIRLIRKIKPDLVHTWLLQMDVLAAAAATFTRVPFVMAERTDHRGHGNNWKYRIRFRFGKKASGIIANSRGGLAYWDRLGKQNTKKTVIKNIVPFAEISRTRDLELKTSFEPNTKLIISACRFIPLKNLHNLLQALKIVLEKCDKLEALFFGRGPLVNEINREIKDLGLEKKIHLMGFSDKLYAWLKSASLFVSVSHFEGTPNAVLEAVACKCPVMISDIPAHREILAKDQAWWASPTSVQEIAGSIEKAVYSPQQAECKANDAYNQIKKYSSDYIAAQYVQAYKDILEHNAK